MNTEAKELYQKLLECYRSRGFDSFLDEEMRFECDDIIRKGAKSLNVPYRKFIAILEEQYLKDQGGDSDDSASSEITEEKPTENDTAAYDNSGTSSVQAESVKTDSREEGTSLKKTDAIPSFYGGEVDEPAPIGDMTFEEVREVPLPREKNPEDAEESTDHESPEPEPKTTASKNDGHDAADAKKEEGDIWLGGWEEDEPGDEERESAEDEERETSTRDTENKEEEEMLSFGIKKKKGKKATVVPNGAEEEIEEELGEEEEYENEEPEEAEDEEVLDDEEEEEDDEEEVLDDEEEEEDDEEEEEDDEEEEKAPVKKQKKNAKKSGASKKQKGGKNKFVLAMAGGFVVIMLIVGGVVVNGILSEGGPSAPQKPRGIKRGPSTEAPAQPQARAPMRQTPPPPMMQRGGMPGAQAPQPMRPSGYHPPASPMTPSSASAQGSMHAPAYRVPEEGGVPQTRMRPSTQPSRSGVAPKADYRRSQPPVSRRAPTSTARRETAPKTGHMDAYNRSMASRFEQAAPITESGERVAKRESRRRASAHKISRNARAEGNLVERSMIEQQKRELAGKTSSEATPAVCDVVDRLQRNNEYVYYVKTKSGEYIPAFQIPGWNGHGVKIGKKTVILDQDDKNGMVEVEKGKYLPVELFSSCTIIQK